MFFSTRLALAPLSLAALLASAGSAHAALDTQAPSLTSFTVSGSVDSSRTGQSVSVQLGASDNLSGVYYYIIEIKAPNGSVIRQEGYNAAASKRFSTKVAIGYPRYMNIEFSEQFGRWSVPGTWSVQSVDLRDLAGNSRVYEKAELAALGNTDFSVSNTQSDQVAPTLLSGTVDTPVLSLSVPPAGLPAGASPMAMVSLRMQDTGSPAASGLDVFSAYYCKLPFNNNECADAFGVVGTTGTPTKAATTLKMSGRLVRTDGSPVSPGTYVLGSVTLQDVAGNANGYVSTALGGSVDFTSFFSGASSITVNP